MNMLTHDVRFGLRMLMKNPAFTVVAVITLALGIGLNTSIFSVVDGVLLKPLPYKNSGQLVKIEKQKPESGEVMPGSGDFVGAAEYLDWREQNEAFSHVAAYEGDGRTVSGSGGAERIQCGEVTYEFFDMLGIQPVTGRVFTAEDDTPSSVKTAILGYGIWQRRFGGDPECVGTTVTIDDHQYVIIGVLPSSFQFIEDYEIWLPMALDPVSERAGGMMRIVSVLGRLKPDSSLDRAVSELSVISERNNPMQRLLNVSAPPPASGPETGMEPNDSTLPAQDQLTMPAAPGLQPVVKEFKPGQGVPEDAVFIGETAAIPEGGADGSAGHGVEGNSFPLPAPGGAGPNRVLLNNGGTKAVNLIPLHEYVTGDVRTALWVLFAAVGFVLLIACVNVANLLLARAAARQKEVAIRSAIGADRSRIIRQLLTESLMLSLSGGVLGFVFSLWGVEALRRISAESLPSIQAFGINFWVLGFTVFVSLLTGVLFGIAPALQSSRVDLNLSMKGAVASTPGGRNRLRGALAVCEVALAFVLLICSGLLIRSFVQLRNVDLGFNAENLLTLSVNLSNERYAEEAQKKQFYDELLERVKAVSDVRSAALADHVPLTGYSLIATFQIENRPQDTSNPARQAVTISTVSQDYFSLMQIRLKQGRVFDDRDIKGAPAAAVVNQAFVDRYLPNEDPLGKRLTGPVSPDNWVTIVGVVDNVLQQGLGAEPQPEVYWHDKQSFSPRMILAVRTQDDPLPLAATIRSIVTAMDSDQPVHSVLTMEQRLAAALAPRRLNMMLLGTFAAIALLMAVIGIYGVMSYLVTQQTKEIGVRIALGARGWDVVRLFLSHGLTITWVGIVIGAAAAFAVSRVITSMLYGISTGDFVTYLCVAMLFTATALLACYIPARRAAKVDPMTALRYE